MDWLTLFRRTPEKTSAQLAKERLQVVVAHRRSGAGDRPKYFDQLQRDLIKVIRKYVQVGEDAVRIDLSRDEITDVLELNITLPEKH